MGGCEEIRKEVKVSSHTKMGYAILRKSKHRSIMETGRRCTERDQVAISSRAARSQTNRRIEKSSFFRLTQPATLWRRQSKRPAAQG